MKFSTLLMTAAVTIAINTHAQEAPAPPQAAPPQDSVLVTVDGTPIMMTEMREMVMTRFGRQLQQVPQEQQATVMQRAQQMVMEDLVSRTLLLNSANKEGIEIPDTETDKRITEITEGLAGGMTLDQVLASAGMKLEDMKDRLKQDAKVGKLIEQVTTDVAQPSEADIKKYFDENPKEFEQPSTVQASHILVSTRGITDPIQLATKEALVKDLQKQLKSEDSKSFAELASAHSDCPSKAEGGDLGSFGKGQMVPEFEAAAFAQEVGVVGDAIKTNFGYHIIKVTDKKEGKKLAFADVQKDLSTKIHEEQKREKVATYIAGLRKDAKIVVPGAPEVPAPK